MFVGITSKQNQIKIAKKPIMLHSELLVLMTKELVSVVAFTVNPWFQQ